MLNFKTKEPRPSQESWPKRLSEKTLADLETIISKEMEPLDLIETGEAMGIPLEEINEDLGYVKTTQDKIRRQNNLALEIKKKRNELQGKTDEEVANYYERLGHLFEGFLYSNISQSVIFKDVVLYKTTLFDDIRNGVDFVAERKDPDNPTSYIALAMDASFSMSPALINKKIERSLRDIGNDALSKVKYFQFEKGAPEARLGLPRVVVGADEDAVRSLLQRWHTKENIPGAEVSFKEDPVWTFMALQMATQLKMFIEEAKFHKQNDLAKICEKYLLVLENSLQANKEMVKEHKKLMSKDGTSIAIDAFCSANSRELGISQKQHVEMAEERADNAIYEEGIRKP